MKAYIWENWNWLYTISKDQTPWTQEVECNKEDIQDFLEIPMWCMNEIQQKIYYILYKSQLELDYDKENT